MSVIEMPTKRNAAAEFTADKKEILAAINGVIAAASKDGVRDVLMRVRITFNQEEGTIRFTTCDSYRLHQAVISTVAIERDATFFVYAKELAASMPKISDVKGEDPLTMLYMAGPAKLDAGEFALKWGTQHRIMRADPEEAIAWPDTDRFFVDFATDFHHNGTSPEPVGFNPAYFGDIAKIGKAINKDKPMAFTPGSTPLKPTMWELRSYSVYFAAILMPVRLEEKY